MNKTYTIKIYSLSGGFSSGYIKTIASELIMNEPRFSSRVGGGQGELTVELALPMDDFGEGVSIKAMNLVRLYEADDENNLTPTLLYSGYISQYVPFTDEGREGVRITALGLVSLLSLDYYMNGSSFQVVAAADPGQIMRNIVDHFNTVYPNTLITYAGGHIVNTGTSVSNTFNDQKWLEALRKTYELGSSGRYWTIREDGNVYFKAKAVSADHRFTIGSDVSVAEVVKNSEQLVNYYQLRWGSTPTVNNYSDATSISTYGRHASIETASDVTDLTSANAKGNKKIADYKDPRVQAKLRINSTYNIESVKPGQTCAVFNRKQGSQLFPSVMLITSVAYSPDFIEIEIENEKGSFSDALTDAIQNVT
jgi:hypothetical protein